MGVAAGGAAHGEADLPKADVLPKAGVLLCPKAGFAGVWAGAGTDAPKALVVVLAGAEVCCCAVWLIRPGYAFFWRIDSLYTKCQALRTPS